MLEFQCNVPYFRHSTDSFPYHGLYIIVDIQYDDGDRDNSLAIEHIRLLSGSEERSTDNSKETAYDEGSLSSSEMKIPSTFQLGMVVEAKYHGRGEIYYRGTICGVSEKGSYNIQYEGKGLGSKLLKNFNTNLPYKLKNLLITIAQRW